MLQQVQQRPKTAPGPDLGKSFSIQSFNSVGNSSSGMLNSSASAGDISPAGGGLAAARQRIADQRAKLQGDPPVSLTIYIPTHSDNRSHRTDVQYQGY